MKNYTITVNGVAYDVTVEEREAGAVSAPRPVVAPVAPAAPKPAAPKAKAEAGSIPVEAGAAGKVFKVEVTVGQALKAGDTVIILEAMKMEIPVVAPKDGTVASIDVSEGQNVDAGQVMATLN
jgi:biotin carboxyl carrier protein